MQNTDYASGRNMVLLYEKKCKMYHESEYSPLLVGWHNHIQIPVTPVHVIFCKI